MRLFFEVTDQQLQDSRDSHFSQLVILQAIDFLGDQCFYRKLEIVFLLELLFAEVLSFVIDPIVEQGRSSLDI